MKRPTMKRPDNLINLAGAGIGFVLLVIGVGLFSLGAAFIVAGLLLLLAAVTP